MLRIERVLISVTNKEGIVDFARALSEKAEIISTGGTAEFLRKNGIPVTEVSDYTGFPEILNGRVKTLHPKIFGGILAQLERKEHCEEMRRQNIKPINMVVVNLYDFKSISERGDVPLTKVLEEIDIGGSALLRAAAKNFPHVVVICDPNDYEKIIEEIKNYGGIKGITRLRLAQKVFLLTSEYDKQIATFLDGARKMLEWSMAAAAEFQVGMKII
ncbi:MAG TPA: IMP cyclohydrolase [Candidatus Desulfofervidus auxilii]|uniref:IMP cyclohydrolase n=1 Tax=Desulfofervidus auxilii TaxID=1621989 RepID=A0A7V0NEA4_DESA2|nr:IMP cyclohydrolase [Candidatus Desulfofervidus auxilii]